MAFSLNQVYFLDEFCKLNKTLSNGACLGEPPGGFCDVGCCCYFLPHWFLRFQATFPCHRHSTMATFGCFSITFLPRALRFWAGIFYPQAFLPCTPSPHCLAHFVTQMRAGIPHSGSSSVPVLTELSFPADAWSKPLVYQLRQWPTKYRVKIKLLNLFSLFRFMWKDYKNFLNKTWWKALLMTASIKLLFFKVILEKEPPGSFT